MPWGSAGLLHGLVPGVHGTLGAVLNVLAFGTLVLTVLGVVLVFEDGLEGTSRWAWLAAVLVLPIVGPLAYLHRRSPNGPPEK